MAIIYDKLGAVANIITPTITLAGLASSATAGRQSTAVTLIEASERVPFLLEIDFVAAVGAGTLALDKAVYLFMARSMDETNYEVGPPAVTATDAAFTFTSSPVSTSPLPTDLYLVGALQFNVASETRRRLFRVTNVPPKCTFVVLNTSGIALSSGAITLRRRWSESV